MGSQYTSPEARAKAVKKAENDLTKDNKTGLDVFKAVFHDMAEHDQATYRTVVTELESVKTERAALKAAYDHMEKRWVASLKQGAGQVKEEEKSIEKEKDPSTATHEAEPQGLRQENEALKQETNRLQQKITSIEKERNEAKEYIESLQHGIDDYKLVIAAHRKRKSNVMEKLNMEEAASEPGGGADVADGSVQTLNEHGTKRKVGEMEAEGGQ